ncbi:MAG TPA: 4-phosphoerythronate dehydrogenase, partial [bacterium]|nr:4-phosphoerythronate dehydrogenase [bacterium]
MRIIADKAIPFLQETFGTLGEVTALHSREITPDTARDADMLIVRTRTRVNEHLLEGSRVRFVASAAVGTDHIDLEYLRTRG